MTIRTVAGLTLALLLASATQAKELSLFDKMELRSACGPDIKAACANVETGNGQLMQCIRDNADALSQQCRDTISRIKAEILQGTGAAMDY